MINLFNTVLMIIFYILKRYFDFIDKAFVFGVLRDFRPYPDQSINERIAKLDTARDSLRDALDAIDLLRVHAEENKREIDEALAELARLRGEQEVAGDELASIRKIAEADVGILRKVAKIPTPAQNFRMQVVGFLGGIGASVTASYIYAWVTSA